MWKPIYCCYPYWRLLTNTFTWIFACKGDASGRTRSSYARSKPVFDAHVRTILPTKAASLPTKMEDDAGYESGRPWGTTFFLSYGDHPVRWMSTQAPMLFGNKAVKRRIFTIRFNLLKEATLYKYMLPRVSQLTAVFQGACCLRFADQCEHGTTTRSLFVKEF